MIKTLIYSLFTLFVNTSAFNILPLSVNKYNIYINDKNFRVYEPNIKNNNKLDCIIFYTGGNANIPSEIYNDFLTKLTSYNISTYIANPDNEINDQLLDKISDEYNSITLVGHSSGSMNAINLCNTNKNIKKIILLDPVDSRVISNNMPFDENGDIGFKINIFNKNKKDNENKNKNKNKNIVLKNTNSVLFLNAKKSYEWNLFPFKIPFIPVFSLDKNLIKFDNNNGTIEYLEASEYGHTDILDSLWSDIMYNTISNGYQDRDSDKLSKYQDTLSFIIKSFIVKDPEEFNNIISNEIFL